MQTTFTLQEPISLSTKLAKPFLKWAGGKGQLIEKLANWFPPEIETGRITKYAEPFVGGGAMFFYIAQTYPSIRSLYISDINEELILAYKTIGQAVEQVVAILTKIEKEYHSLDNQSQKEYFYQQRADFNKKLAAIDFRTFRENWIERTATIIFLNRTCYNGLFRVNSKGEFNTPFGDYKNPRICDAENLLNVSSILKYTQIECDDFASSQDFIDEHTFVYFDPPYRPISKTANFTAYSRHDFSEKEQKRLAEYFAFLTRKGAKLMLSNSDPKNENPEDTFFEELYRSFAIDYVDAARMINCNSNKRGKIRELVIRNYRE